MTTQTAVFASPSGMTLTAKLFTLAAPDTEVTGNAITVTERTNAKGQYVASIVRVSALPAGDYTLILFSGSVPVAVGGRTFAGTDLEVATTTPEAAVLDSATQTKISNIEDDAAASVGYLTTLVSRLTANAATAVQNLFHMITGTGVSSKYTVTALENAPAGGGGGSATLEKQEEILTAIGEISTAQLAAITVESGVISNFPDTLTIGDSYDTDTGWIKVLITDEADDPITGLGDLLFSEADISFTAFRPNDSARVYGVCEFVDAGSETYVKLTLTSEETTKGLPEYTYEGRLKFVWDSTSVSSDLVESRQKTYKTAPFKFIANP